MSDYAASAPALTPAQVARLASLGRRRRVAAGEVLVEIGERHVLFFVVTAGRVEAVHPAAAGDVVVLTLGPGMFTR